MVFTEQNIDGVYEYTVNDAFGTVTIYSPQRLDAERLDDVFIAIYKAHAKDQARIINDKKIQGTNIKYSFTKISPWDDLEE